MKIRRFFYALLGVVLTAAVLAAPFPVAADGYPLAEDISLSSQSAIIVYVDPAVSGIEAINRGADSVLFEQQADKRIAPGAVNRLALGIAAMNIINRKNINMDTATGRYNYTLQASYVWGTGLITAGMGLGETWTIRDLLELSMIQTAADACVTLAYTLGGSIQLFVDEMNNAASRAGCTNTWFTNVTGADDPDQYTSARDTYKLLRLAMDYPELEAMMSASECSVSPVSGESSSDWPNTNSLLRASSDYYYEPAVLGKTGVSEADGASLASLSEADGYRYLAVTLGSREDGGHYKDTRALYRWAFNQFTYKTIVTGGQPVTRVGVNFAWNVDSVNLVAKHPLSCLVLADLDENTVSQKITLYDELLGEDGRLDAPVEKGTVIGKIELYIRTDQKIGEVELVTGESVNRSELLRFGAALLDFFSSPWFWAGLALLAVLVIAYAVLIVRYNRRNRRHQRTRRYKPMK